MIVAYVPFKADVSHIGDLNLVVGKWYIPTYHVGEYFGPYATQDIATKAVFGLRSQQGTVCQTCED